jgi:RNA polymerase subunit RPABC4/transcription elongation factor Spt4
MMRCERCQTEFDNDSKVCPECGHSVGTVEVLSPEEREDFRGLTIESPGPKEKPSAGYSYEYQDSGKGVYVRRFNFNAGKAELLNRILVGLIVVGLLFLAFPMLFMFLAVMVIGGFLSLLLRRR